jgi:hypothetical protein
MTLQVLPLSESEGEQEALFSPNDVRVEVMRSRGAGGQVRSSLYNFCLAYKEFSTSIKRNLLSD